jgi:hypothetical protein
MDADVSGLLGPPLWMDSPVMSTSHRVKLLSSHTLEWKRYLLRPFPEMEVWESVAFFPYDLGPGLQGRCPSAGYIITSLCGQHCCSWRSANVGAICGAASGAGRGTLALAGV